MDWASQNAKQFHSAEHNIYTSTKK